MKKAILVGSLLLSFVGGCSFGVVMWRSPGIVDIPSSSDECQSPEMVCTPFVDLEHYNKLKGGMTIKEVEEILGGPGACHKNSTPNEYFCEWYSTKLNQTGGRDSIAVSHLNGIVNNITPRMDTW